MQQHEQIQHNQFVDIIHHELMEKVPKSSFASKDSGLQSIEESTALSELFTADWSKKSYITVR